MYFQQAEALRKIYLTLFGRTNGFFLFGFLYIDPNHQRCPSAEKTSLHSYIYSLHQSSRNCQILQRYHFDLIVNYGMLLVFNTQQREYFFLCIKKNKIGHPRSCPSFLSRKLLRKYLLFILV